jgi:hypothetical protein
MMRQVAGKLKIFTMLFILVQKDLKPCRIFCAIVTGLRAKKDKHPFSAGWPII